MYVEGLADLGFSLKPPKWLRNVVGAVVKQTHVTVPTPTGSQTFDLNNPADVARMKQIVSQTKVSVGPPAPTPAENLNAAVTGAVPGGWGTLAVAGGLGLAALFILPRVFRAHRNPRRRRRSRRRV